ncbi:HNH endonuclease [bacterium AH-315-C08]|nr:HNH endonuclease [bacterium AH-315-C08]
MSASYPTKLLLAFRSGDRCAMPDCGKELTLDGHDADPAVLGEAAHIAGENNSKARYNSEMTDEERNSYFNLIYLCPNCHTQIDKQVDDFSVEKLQELKAAHEQTVRDALAEAFADIGFPELEEATQWVLQVQPTPSQPEFSIVPPDEKIKKNELTNGSRSIITMGLSVAREVRSFVESLSQTDSDFPERLKMGFLQEYYRLRKEGYKGDDLFDFMCKFAQRGFDMQAKKTAGLAVLIYLFEACEVFEK